MNVRVGKEIGHGGQRFGCRISRTWRRAARDNPARAERHPELRGTCLALAGRPARFPLVLRYEPSGGRRRGRRSDLIFYRVDLDPVAIVPILHGAQEYAKILFPA